MNADACDQKKLMLKISLSCLQLLEHAVAQLVEALRYQLEDCGFDSQRCHWNISLT
jgi:hypothetical protein